MVSNRSMHSDSASGRSLHAFVSHWRGAMAVGRSLKHGRGLAAAAIVTVALGIGVNSVIFSLFDRLLFRPLPFKEPGDLVQIYSHSHSALGYPSLPTKVMLELARQPNLFSGIAWAPGGELAPMAPFPGENPLFWFTGVTTNTLDVLGIRPVIGSGFSTYPATNVDRPVLLTYQVWQRRYGGSSDVLSLEWTARDTQQREVRWRVVGVLPREFVLPSPQLASAEFDGIYGIDPGFGRQLSLDVVGAAPFARVAPGVSLPMAQARVNAFMAATFPRWRNPISLRSERATATVVPLQSGLASATRSLAWLTVVAAWAVLAATCVTLSLLLLTWSQSRQRDAGVRLALGASPERLIVGGLAEAFVLCGVGAFVGLVVHVWVRPVFVMMLPAGLQSYASDAGALRVISATCGLAILTAAATGIIPAIRTSRSSALDVLRPRGDAFAGHHLVGGPTLLAVQATFGLLLLVGAAATVPGVTKALMQPPGFTAADLYTIYVPTADDETASDGREQVRRGREARDLARALPGVASVSLSAKDPFWLSPIEKERTLRDSTPGTFAGRVVPVDMDLFATLATPLLAGRTFSADEVERQALVAMVNESAARVLSPETTASATVGRTVSTGDGARLIVGVVDDARLALNRAAAPTVFLPLSAAEAYRKTANNPYHWNAYQLLVRMQPGRVPDVSQLSDRLRQRPWMIDRWVGARRESVAAKLNVDLATPRLLALVFGTLGGITLLLVVVAVFGLASFEVRRRREEMTVRLALGASPRALRCRLALATVRPIAVGVVLGLPLSWIVTTLLSRSVPTIHANDPVIYGAAAMTMTAVALAAAWLPAWRSITLRVGELVRPG